MQFFYNHKRKHVTTNEIEKHPLQPFLPENATILILGSFPPPKQRWKINFFYPNFQNDMWRVFGLIFFEDKNHFLTKNFKSFDEQLIKFFLIEKRIAIWDTAIEIRRLSGNASDKFLEVITPINLKEILRKLPNCKAIILTGKKATETLLSIFHFSAPQIGSFSEIKYNNRKLKIYRMPSPSRAYPKTIEQKSYIYKKMFNELK